MFISTGSFHSLVLILWGVDLQVDIEGVSGVSVVDLTLHIVLSAPLIPPGHANVHKYSDVLTVRHAPAPPSPAPSPSSPSASKSLELKQTKKEPFEKLAHFVLAAFAFLSYWTSV